MSVKYRTSTILVLVFGMSLSIEFSVPEVNADVRVSVAGQVGTSTRPSADDDAEAGRQSETQPSETRAAIEKSSASEASPERQATVTSSSGGISNTSRDLNSLRRAFQDYSGARLVFTRDDLPEGKYHDILKPLLESRKRLAAEICLREAKMYPRDYFADMGLKVIGVFSACISTKTSDQRRPYDAQLGGYRFFGVYNGVDAVAAAFYSEGQLSLTFHHEVFHHVDSTVAGETARWQLSSDDALYQAAITGMRPYRAPPIAAKDLQDLRTACIGITLKDAVSEYASKNYREDQAETARHVMSMLPNALVQVIDQPHLAGSQRILHVLREYEQSVMDGPDFDWFVDVALGRSRSVEVTTSAETLIESLRMHTEDQTGTNFPGDGRDLLRAAVRIDPSDLSTEQAAELVMMCSALTEQLLHERLRPDARQENFDIWGSEDSKGVNYTLRHDVAQIAKDSRRLSWIFDLHGTPSDDIQLTRTLLKRVRMLARYSRFIQTHWMMSRGTAAVFDEAKVAIFEALPATRSYLAQQLRDVPLDVLVGEDAAVSEKE